MLSTVPLTITGPVESVGCAAVAACAVWVVSLLESAPRLQAKIASASDDESINGFVGLITSLSTSPPGKSGFSRQESCEVLTSGRFSRLQLGVSVRGVCADSIGAIREGS